MGKKKKYIPENFESVKGEGDTSSNIYKSMLMGAAWKKATPQGKVLYVTMKSSLYGLSKHDKDGFAEEYRLDNRYFTFNEAKWIKGNEDGFELYSNKNSFYKDVAQLIGLGFIDCVEVGCNTRTKNLYRFSNRWTLYGTSEFSVPYSCMTESMRGSKKLSDAEKAERKEKVDNDAKREKELGV